MAREGIRWHLIERRRGRYDFSSVLPLLDAARAARVQVVWDLFHYGWPDDIDIFSPEFVRCYAGLARAFADFVGQESEKPLIVAPVNEISYVAWAAGTVGRIYPCEKERGPELKRQLVRAAIAGIEAVWEAAPTARIVHPDPVINVIADPARPEDESGAAAYRRGQYESWDMLCGQLAPELGGAPKYLDIIGVNYYPANQWFLDGATILRGRAEYRPFREILAEVYARYGRPIIIAETSDEGASGPAWLRYVCGETKAAMRAGVEIEGICIYPVLDYPGWDDDRLCSTGLWGYAVDDGRREIKRPLAWELRRQRRAFVVRSA